MNTLTLNDELTILDDFPPVSYEAWKAQAIADLQGVPFEKKLVSHLYEGLDIQPLYTAENSCSANDSGLPGNPPYTRGMKPLAHVNGWDIRQEVCKASPIEANADMLEELQHGTTSIELKLDAAASNGLDADDSRATDFAGHDGVMLYHRGDFAQVFKNVALNSAPVSLEAGSAFLPAAALLATQWAEQGIDNSQAMGNFNADPLSALMLHGELPMSLNVAMGQMVELAAWTAGKYPKVKAIRVSTAVYHHAGASSVQDLAYAIGTAVDYLRALTAADMDINAAVKQISFHIALSCRFFQSIAKLRALRKLWAKVALACGADPEAITSLHIATVTSRRVMTCRDPWVNLLRNTAACFAGAIGGADSITTLPIDIRLKPSDEFSRHLARKTQLILQEECNIARVVDPAGGSWFLESLTEQLAESAWALFQDIEAQGGIIKVALKGDIHQQIQAVESQREQDLATRKVSVTGVSEHADVFEEPLSETIEDSHALYQQAVINLKKWRPAQSTQTVLQNLKQLATQTDRPLGELAEATFAAAKAGATIGQLAAALHANPSENNNIQLPPLTVHPYAAAFEELRNIADQYAQTHQQQRPKVFLANLGQPKEFLARATFASDFFEAGGFEPINTDGFSELQPAVAAFVASGAKIAIICSSDQNYATEVEKLAPLLKSAGARTVVLAGNPGSHEASYRQAGVDRFIFLKCNVLAILSALLQEELASPSH